MIIKKILKLCVIVLIIASATPVASMAMDYPHSYRIADTEIKSFYPSNAPARIFVEAYIGEIEGSSRTYSGFVNNDYRAASLTFIIRLHRGVLFFDVDNPQSPLSEYTYDTNSPASNFPSEVQAAYSAALRRHNVGESDVRGILAHTFLPENEVTLYYTPEGTSRSAVIKRNERSVVDSDYETRVHYSKYLAYSGWGDDHFFKIDSLVNLLEYGRPEDIEKVIDDGIAATLYESAYSYAEIETRNGYSDYTKALSILRGADANHTELMTAAEEGNIEKVSSLLKAGANVNQQNIFGETALMLAMRNTSGGIHSILSALLDAGADVRITDNQGQRAVNHADRRQPNLKGTEIYARLM